MHIARWVGEEIEAQSIRTVSPSGFDIHASATDLIDSIPPGVWSWLPQNAQNGLIDAQQNIREGRLDGAALLLFRWVEIIFRDFYVRILPDSRTNLSVSDMSHNLFNLNDRELVAPLHNTKDLWLNDRNLTVHEGKSYDKYEIISLWHLSLRAITRMTRILDRRFPMPSKD